MPRSTKNQWDFGDLFGDSDTAPIPAAKRAKVQEPAEPPKKAVVVPPAAPPRRVSMTVTELTLGIKRQLETTFGSVRVTGEISNFRLQSSGHAYFVLKDANAQLSCVLFRGQGGADRNQIKDGVKVTLGGEITVYEPRGQYQLRVLSVELEGIGALQVAFERLKARLQAEGLFDPQRKRAIASFPRRVGLITSPTGAAIRDVLHVVERRFPGLEFLLVPVRVQGEGAAEQVADAVRILNDYQRAHPGSLDVLLITRGGGSLEDLWCFNEECVARAIAASEIPVISAVGHEIDFTIADFVADLRAATPSAAAEILTAGYVLAGGRLAETSRRLHWIFQRIFEDFQERLGDYSDRLARIHPRRQLETRAQRLDDLNLSLLRESRRRVRESQVELAGMIRRWQDRRPASQVRLWRQRLGELGRRLSQAGLRQWEQNQQRLDRANQSRQLLSPLAVLDRGYSLTFDSATGRLLRRSEEVTAGQRLRTRLSSGEIESVVEGSKGGEPV